MPDVSNSVQFWFTNEHTLRPGGGTPFRGRDTPSEVGGYPPSLIEGGSRMRFTETANPKQLAIMTNAFDNYCLVRNIIDDNGKEDAARLIFLLFEGGARTAEEIRAGLQRLNASH